MRGGVLERRLRIAVDDAVQQLCAAVSRGQLDVDGAMSRELGQVHARAGLPLSDLTVWYLGAAFAVCRVFAQLERSGELPKAWVRPCSDLARALVQNLSREAVDAYLAAVPQPGGTPARVRRIELARRLVEGETTDRAALQLLAEAAQWPLPEQLVVAVTSPVEGTSALGSLPQDTLVAPHGSGLCLLVPVWDGQLPTIPAGEAMVVAVGPAVSWQRASVSLQIAEQLLELARNGGTPSQGVLWTADHGAELILDYVPTIAGELVRAQLQPLLELPLRRRQPLIETLAAWVRRSGSTTEVARDLHVSVRTVRHRLARLRELLGGLVDDPDQRFELDLALRAVDHRDAGAIAPQEAQAPRRGR